MGNDKKKKKVALDDNYDSDENKDENKNESKDESKVEPNSKNVFLGKDFEKLLKRVIKLEAKSLHYSKRKNSKYFVTFEDGKKVHFGSPKYQDYHIHQDKERREKYLSRANKAGELTFEKPESANYWTVNLLCN